MLIYFAVNSDDFDLTFGLLLFPHDLFQDGKDWKDYTMGTIMAMMALYNFYLIYKLNNNIKAMMAINLDLHSNRYLRRVARTNLLIGCLYIFSFVPVIVAILYVLKMNLFYKYKDLLQFYPNDLKEYKQPEIIEEVEEEVYLGDELYIRELEARDLEAKKLAAQEAKSEEAENNSEEVQSEESETTTEVTKDEGSSEENN